MSGRDVSSIGVAAVRTPPAWRWVAALVVVYVVSGRLGLGLAFYQQHATLVWAPSGLAVAAVWLGGRRMVVGVWLAALLVNLAIGSSPALAATIACGNTAEALVAAALARRVGIDPRLASVRDVIWLIVLLVVLSTTVSATVGVAALVAFAGLPAAQLAPTWLIWWLGDAGGVLTVTPMVLALLRPDAPAFASRGVREPVLLAAVVALTALLAFGGRLSTAWLGLPVALLPYPALTWAALRFGMRGATAATVLVIAGAVVGTAVGTGPFQHPNIHIAMATLWVFMATLAVSTMVLGASLEERARGDELRREMELRLERSERLSSLGLLAGGIAHDFNNILAVIGANVSLARGDRRGDAIDAIDHASRRAAELTAQLLAYAGQRPMQRTSVDLAAIATETVRLLGATVPPSARVHEEHAAEVPAVNGDAAQLRHVVLNLVVNAVEALDGAPGEVRVRTRVPAAGELPPDGLQPGDWLILTVADTGRGMDEATRRRVFEPFFTTKPRGRGLGMAAVHGIVRSHGGGIDIISAPGRGTEFRVWLPVSGQVEGTPPPLPAPTPAPTAGSILIIDDEPALREVTQFLLEDSGWEVRAAASGAEGLAMLEARLPTVVLLDLTMPGRGGIDILHDLRERYPSLPVVLMSGYGEDRLAGEKLEQVVFLAKPFRAEDLYARIAAVLGR